MKKEKEKKILDNICARLSNYENRKKLLTREVKCDKNDKEKLESRRLGDEGIKTGRKT